jgi:hypothetical protein
MSPSTLLLYLVTLRSLSLPLFSSQTLGLICNGSYRVALYAMETIDHHVTLSSVTTRKHIILYDNASDTRRAKRTRVIIQSESPNQSRDLNALRE